MANTPMVGEGTGSSPDAAIIQASGPDKPADSALESLLVKSFSNTVNPSNKQQGYDKINTSGSNSGVE